MPANTDFANPAQAIRDVAEKGSAQVKENMEKISAAAGEATHVMKDAYSANLKGAREYSAKVLEFANTNTKSAFEFAQQLTSVKSPTEFFAMSSNHFRQEFETLTRQAQELAAIAQKITASTTETIKSGMHMPR